MQEFLSCAVELAKQAGKIQLDSLKKDHHIEYKGAINLVTEVDKKCEALIVGTLAKHFPHHDILAEEGSGKRKQSEYRWIIDPLDGTINYAHQFPFFCVSIALEFQGELVLGVIFDPNRDELFTAVKGEGAFLNGKRLQVSNSPDLVHALLATGFAYNVQEEQADNLDHFAHFIKKARAVRRPGSAAIDLAWIACGRIDGFWELFLKPWDIAAGVVIIREAGGQVSSFDGGSFDVYGDEILTSNGKIHQEMVDVLCQNR
ncbi:MAG: inositol monophosphatase [Deltaproteobacteria bacterium CG_4_10_14_0_2_um_filter_43_8]|nr:MAG: inositol monophosphatase [Deltaproteobacteria bacterium CG11_big_fil_rev_8_21_14_0_20_42_23]PJA18901.1 MAG: inositol monophosphatase [Deltaproteobacteria bacterium CG_4_10_14_0_2_um_filter_43_8]PJC63528.1 MAG: inositol monophosphatase [Deltaproteobacteria bacterium CG_4_9_14_0_2_um_filter_42_21]